VISRLPGRKSVLASFRAKLLAAMMLVVSAISVLGIFLAERQLAANVKQNREREFQGQVAALHDVEEMRHAALAERCRTLAQQPRIHAALEDNALDLLYPSAKDELRDLMGEDEEESQEAATRALHATFYRFLDGDGVLIQPPNQKDVGELKPEEESQLSLGSVPTEQQIGYLVRSVGMSKTIDEVIAMPIVSTETNQPIAALVVGFKPVELSGQGGIAGIRSGIWLNGRAYLPPLANTPNQTFGDAVTAAMPSPDLAERSTTIRVDGASYLLFYKRLNPNSLFPPAYEICIYPLADLLARQRHLRWQIIGAGALLMLGGFVASNFASARLSVPVRKLAVDSAENRAQRERAEAALEVTHQELERSARFSANTSHQLKTPVTVLRAGLEELLTSDHLTAEMREEISALIHQTFRITSIIEDLLLLSQMDAGRIQINFTAVDLTQLIEGQMDDLSALPNSVTAEIESSPAAVQITGEKHYTALILQNLLENARKYNRPGGRIRISCHTDGNWALLTIGNTGHTIPLPAQEHIFERFYRGPIGEDVGGHGLGLNIARDLARLHGGDLRLVRSEDDWTEFEVRFRLVRQIMMTPAGAS